MSWPIYLQWKNYSKRDIILPETSGNFESKFASDIHLLIAFYTCKEFVRLERVQTDSKTKKLSIFFSLCKFDCSISITKLWKFVLSKSGGYVLTCYVPTSPNFITSSWLGEMNNIQKGPSIWCS